jgi:hypothetical protein
VRQHDVGTVCVCQFHLLLCCLTGAGAGFIGAVVVARCVCGCTPVFPERVALRPEEFDELAGPLRAVVIFCVKSLRSEEGCLQFIPLIGNVALMTPNQPI